MGKDLELLKFLKLGGVFLLGISSVACHREDVSILYSRQYVIPDYTKMINDLNRKVGDVQFAINNIEQKEPVSEVRDSIDPKTHKVVGNWLTFGKKTVYIPYGKDGINGTNGKDGKDGINGTNGKDGKDGINGTNGKDGKDGINGTNGKDGKTPLITMGADGFWYIDEVKTEYPWRGVNGTNGKDGKDGINGTNGKDGKDGIDGTNGKDGKDGIDGTNGKDGKDGINGTNGKDGKDGTNGKDGKDGINGTNGKDGKDGTNGKDGRDGIDGTNGKDGKDGAKGADGLTPIFGIKQGDGNDGTNKDDFYWTITWPGGSETLVDGDATKAGTQPVRANGHDGKDGENGQDGRDGLDSPLVDVIPNANDNGDIISYTFQVQYEGDEKPTEYTIPVAKNIDYKETPLALSLTEISCDGSTSEVTFTTEKGANLWYQIDWGTIVSVSDTDSDGSIVVKIPNEFGAKQVVSAWARQVDATDVKWFSSPTKSLVVPERQSSWPEVKITTTKYYDNGGSMWNHVNGSVWVFAPTPAQEAEYDFQLRNGRNDFYGAPVNLTWTSSMGTTYGGFFIEATPYYSNGGSAELWISPKGKNQYVKVGTYTQTSGSQRNGTNNTAKFTYDPNYKIAKPCPTTSATTTT